MKRIGTAMVLALLACASAIAANTEESVIRTVDRPYRKAEAAQAQAPKAAPTFTLLATDVNVPRAFERWARERRMTVRWLVDRDHDIDAAAPEVVLEPADLELARREGSADPELAAAMMKVARSFKRSKAPFVIREYDNAFVVEPKSGNRP